MRRLRVRILPCVHSKSRFIYTRSGFFFALAHDSVPARLSLRPQLAQVCPNPRDAPAKPANTDVADAADKHRLSIRTPTTQSAPNRRSRKISVPLQKIYKNLLPHHRQILLPRAYLILVLFGHDAGGLADVAQVVGRPCGQQLAEGHLPEVRVVAGAGEVVFA